MKKDKIVYEFNLDNTDYINKLLEQGYFIHKSGYDSRMGGSKYHLRKTFWSMIFSKFIN